MLSRSIWKNRSSESVTLTLRSERKPFFKRMFRPRALRESLRASTALADLDVVALRRAGVQLARAADLHRRVRDHLREHRLRNADGAVDDARIEIHVRVQLALDEVLVLQRDLFDPERQLEQ